VTDGTSLNFGYWNPALCGLQIWYVTLRRIQWLPHTKHRLAPLRTHSIHVALIYRRSPVILVTDDVVK